MSKLDGLQGHAASAMIRLLREGFDKRSAKTLAEKYPLERIQRQINLMARRKAGKSRLGMLRKAIEEDWPSPEQQKAKKKAKLPPRGPRTPFKAQPRDTAASTIDKRKAKEKLQQLEREFQTRWPELLAKFNEDEIKRREDIEKMPLVSQALIDAALNSFDAPETKLERLREAFPKAIAAQR